MSDNSLKQAYNYAEYNVDFALVGKGNNGNFCIQLITNKPFPVIKSINTQDQHSANVELEMSGSLTHECTFYIGKEQLVTFKEALEQALGSEG